MILQANPETLIQFMGITGKELTLLGVLFIAVILLIYFLIKSHKNISKIQDERLLEAKETAKSIQNIAEKFMLQTNKMILVIELFKSRTNGTN